MADTGFLFKGVCHPTAYAAAQAICADSYPTAHVSGVEFTREYCQAYVNTGSVWPSVTVSVRVTSGATVVSHTSMSGDMPTPRCDPDVSYAGPGVSMSGAVAVNPGSAPLQVQLAAAQGSPWEFTPQQQADSYAAMVLVFSAGFGVMALIWGFRRILRVLGIGASGGD